MRSKRAQFAAFKKVTSFVFRYFLASFPLFCVSTQFALPPSPGPFRSLERLGSSGARLRQTVPNKTTIIGYHKAGGLSSEKWERPRGAFSGPRPAHAPVL